jgi:urease accessory protein
MKTRLLFGFTGPLIALPDLAMAHGLIGGGLVDGLVHPIGGPDHLLAMVAVGLISARIGGVSLYGLPGVFLATMAMGFAMATQAAGLADLAEAGILASVLALGLLMLAPELLLRRVAWAVTALFGMCHGYAHGIELPTAASPWLYTAGFLAVSAGLHLLGVLLGKVFLHQHRPALGFSIAGMAVGLAGMALVALQ